MAHPELIRDGVNLIKRRFAEWRTPPVETPADSVIEECVAAIVAAARVDALEIAKEAIGAGRPHEAASIDCPQCVRDQVYVAVVRALSHKQ